MYSASVLKGWIEDISEILARKEKLNTAMIKMVIPNMIDVVLILFMIVLLLGDPNDLWLILLILFVAITLRECFQMVLSMRRYIRSWENCIEVLTILLVGILLFKADLNDENKGVMKNLAAFAIVLSWSELITLAARHPRLTR